MTTSISIARRRSLSLSVTVKETSRAPCLLPIVRHAHPWNKYCKDISVIKPRKAITLSNPKKEEFQRIRSWAIEKQRQEARHVELLRRKEAILAQRENFLSEKQRDERLSKLVEEIRMRREKRGLMQKQREEAQKEYLLLRRNSRSVPLLHEIIQTEFQTALEKLENAKREVYHQRVKPFRTIRPGEIIATDALRTMGKFPDGEQTAVPFELGSWSVASTCRWQTTRRMTDPGTKQVFTASSRLPAIHRPQKETVHEMESTSEKKREEKISLSTQTKEYSEMNAEAKTTECVSEQLPIPQETDSVENTPLPPADSTPDETEPTGEDIAANLPNQQEFSLENVEDKNCKEECEEEECEDVGDNVEREAITTSVLMNGGAIDIPKEDDV